IHPCSSPSAPASTASARASCSPTSSTTASPTSAARAAASGLRRYAPPRRAPPAPPGASPAGGPTSRPRRRCSSSGARRRGAGGDAAREFLARLVPALGARAALGALAFAGRTRVLAYPVAGRARPGALVPGGDVDDLEPDETDLAAALARATALCPDDRRAAL